MSNDKPTELTDDEAKRLERGGSAAKGDVHMVQRPNRKARRQYAKKIGAFKPENRGIWGEAVEANKPKVQDV